MKKQITDLHIQLINNLLKTFIFIAVYLFRKNKMHTIQYIPKNGQLIAELSVLKLICYRAYLFL